MGRGAGAIDGAENIAGRDVEGIGTVPFDSTPGTMGVISERAGVDDIAHLYLAAFFTFAVLIVGVQTGIGTRFVDIRRLQ